MTGPDEAVRAWLRGLGDAIVPAFENLPCASDADPDGKFLDRALAARPDLAETAARLMDGAEGPPEAVLERLARESPDELAGIRLLVQGAYFMNPKVRRRLGYPGQRATPILEGEAEHYLDEAKLAAVVARGRVYRPTP